MALDDDGMKNQYLTKLRVKIREDSDIMRELTEMLHDFALSYNAELQSVGNVDQYNPRAQEFLEAWEALRQDFDVWVGQISFADVLELQAMWNNREIWPRRLARLPSIAPPRVDEEQEPTPEMPPIMPGMPAPPPAPAKGVPKGAGKGSAGTPSWVGQASWNFSEHSRMNQPPPAAPSRAPSEPPPPTPSGPLAYPPVTRLRVEGDGRYPYRDRHYFTRVATAAPAA